MLLNTTAAGAATPSFSGPTNFTAGDGPSSIAIADVNGDFKPDLAVANGNSTGASGVSVLLNTTAGGAATPTFATASSFDTGDGPSSVATGDVDADGKPDLAIANSRANSVSVLLNTTAGGATAPSFADPTDFEAGNGANAVAIADINGDGKADLATANYNTTGPGGVSALLNATAGGAGKPSFLGATNFSAGDTPVSVGVTPTSTATA